MICALPWYAVESIPSSEGPTPSHHQALVRACAEVGCPRASNQTECLHPLNRVVWPPARHSLRILSPARVGAVHRRRADHVIASGEPNRRFSPVRNPIDMTRMTRNGTGRGTGSNRLTPGDDLQDDGE